MGFYWGTVPAIMTFISTISIFCHHASNPRRALFSAACGVSLYAIAFLLWGQCAYLGWTDVCWTGGWSWYVEHKDMEVLRYIAPWLALVTAGL